MFPALGTDGTRITQCPRSCVASCVGVRFRLVGNSRWSDQRSTKDEGATPIAGTVKHTELSSRTARKGLKRGRKPYWQALVRGKVHLGYQCWKGAPAGRWMLRRYIGNEKYSVMTLGVADDAAKANDSDVLDFEQAKAKALARVEIENGHTKTERVTTVRQAMASYIDYLRDQGKSISDIQSRSTVHILPPLGDLVIAELTTKQLRRWLADMAEAPAQKRSKDGELQFRQAPSTDDQVRARRATANRVLTMLKAALNFAFREEHVGNDKEWRRVQPFENVDAARKDYLEIDAAQRLINASDPEFRPLVCAALETGCHYSELTRLEVHDFHSNAGTIAVRKSKTGKARDVILTPEGAKFFRQHCAGLSGNELMFRHGDGRRWEKSEQSRPMDDACEHGKIKPRITFHALRHTWASHAVMNGVPLLVVAKNLGHRDTRMVEKHYGHLAKSFVTEAIHANAPRFGTTTPTTVTPLSRRRS